MMRPQRHDLSLLLSVVMTTLLLCQGMARGASPLPDRVSMGAMAVDCHGDRALAQSADNVDCGNDCQHQEATKDAGKLSLVSPSALGLLYILPVIVVDASPIPSAALPLYSPATDPPLVIRLQRFRE